MLAALRRGPLSNAEYFERLVGYGFGGVRFQCFRLLLPCQVGREIPLLVLHTAFKQDRFRGVPEGHGKDVVVTDLALPSSARDAIQVGRHVGGRLAQEVEVAVHRRTVSPPRSLVKKAGYLSGRR